MSHPISVQHEIVSGAPGIDTVRAKAYWSPLGLAFRLVQPVFGASITIDCSQGSYFQVVATGSTNITLANPTNVPNAIAFQIIIEIQNQSGGAMGTVSFGTAYKNPATAPFSTQPASTKNQVAAWCNVGTQAAPNRHLIFKQSSDSAS
jgi:hypothetical protein